MKTSMSCATSLGEYRYIPSPSSPVEIDLAARRRTSRAMIAATVSVTTWIVNVSPAKITVSSRPVIGLSST